MTVPVISQAKALPVIDASVRKLCCQPYPGHRKGCPNYNSRPSCPPSCPLWGDVCNTHLATWLFWTRFNLAEHRERMKAKHPNWSRRQLDCCLYWQNRARKPLSQFVRQQRRIPGFYISLCPEAMGINLTATMKGIGVVLEWPPVIWARQIAMGGWLK